MATADLSLQTPFLFIASALQSLNEPEQSTKHNFANGQKISREAHHFHQSVEIRTEDLDISSKQTPLVFSCGFTTARIKRQGSSFSVATACEYIKIP